MKDLAERSDVSLACRSQTEILFNMVNSQVCLLGGLTNNLGISNSATLYLVALLRLLSAKTYYLQHRVVN